MLKSIFNFIGDVFSAISSLFGFLKQRDSELNSPAMVKNKEAQQEQNLKDKVVDDLKSGNTINIEKDIAD